MRLHFHRWHYPCNGSTLRICRKCSTWQRLIEYVRGDVWQTMGSGRTRRLET